MSVYPSLLRPKLSQKKIKPAENRNLPEAPRLAPSRLIYASTTQPQVGEGVYLWGQSAPPSVTLWPPLPLSSHLRKGRCDPAGTVPLTLGEDFAPKPRPGEQRVRGCQCWGARGVPALKGPPAPRSAPRVGVPLSRGAERGRPGQRQVWEGHLPWLSDCPRQAVSPPHLGRGWVRTPGGGRLGAPHQRAPGRAGFARSMWEPLQGDTLPSLPETCCVITPRSRGSPPKANGGVCSLT